MLSENISTGYTSLDHPLGGFKKGELVLLAARPGMGKTTFLINLSERIKAHARVLFISLELNADRARQRFGLALSYMLSAAQQSTLELTYTTSLAKKWSNLPCGTSCRNGIQLGTNLTADQSRWIILGLAILALITSIMSKRKVTNGNQSS